VVGVAAFVASLTNPVTGLIAVVGLLGAAWGANWGDIQGKTKVVVDWLQDVALPAIGGFLGRAGEQFDYLVTEIAQATALVSRALREGVAGWGALFDAFGTTLREAVDGWGAGFDALGTAVRGAVDTVGDLFDRLGTTVRDALFGPDGIVTRLQGGWDTATNAIEVFSQKVTVFFTTLFGDLGEKLHRWLYEDPGFVGGWLGALEEIAGAIGTWISDRATQLGDFFSDLGTRVRAGLLDAPDGLVPRWTDALGQIASALGAWVTDRLADVGGFFDRLGSAVRAGCSTRPMGWCPGSWALSRRCATTSAARSARS
jgi:hypothetical protein